LFLDDQTLRLTRVGGERLRMVRFEMSEREFEQNPKNPSRWGQLAPEKHQVVQFRDVATGKYAGVAVDGGEGIWAVGVVPGSRILIGAAAIARWVGSYFSWKSAPKAAVFP
jgi:hypothetical protein